MLINGFQLTEYQRHVAEIVKYTESGSQFERAAIREVARDHGEDPSFVARDVAELRAAKG